MTPGLQDRDGQAALAHRLLGPPLGVVIRALGVGPAADHAQVDEAPDARLAAAASRRGSRSTWTASNVCVPLLALDADEVDHGVAAAQRARGHRVAREVAAGRARRPGPARAAAREHEHRVSPRAQRPTTWRPTNPLPPATATFIAASRRAGAQPPPCGRTARGGAAEPTTSSSDVSPRRAREAVAARRQPLECPRASGRSAGPREAERPLAVLLEGVQADDPGVGPR